MNSSSRSRLATDVLLKAEWESFGGGGGRRVFRRLRVVTVNKDGSQAQIHPVLDKSMSANCGARDEGACRRSEGETE